MSLKPIPTLNYRTTDRGYVMILALIGIMTMAFFLITGTSTTSTTIKVSGNYSKTVDSFNYAEVGVAKARPILETNDFSTLLTTYTQVALPLIAKTAFNEGFYEVFLMDNDDGDSNPYADSDDIVIVRSIGTNAMGGTVQIEAHMQKPTASAPLTFPADPSSGPSAALLCGPRSDARTQGASRIAGHDYTVPTLPCSGAGCSGTNTGGSAYAIVAEGPLTTSGTGFVSNSTPKTLQNVGDTNCSQWRTLRDQLVSLDPSHPDVVVLTAADSPVTTSLNTCSNPKIFIISAPGSSTFRFSGNAGVCGIVAVASNTAIETTGTVTLAGLVMMMGMTSDMTFVASSGTPQIMGKVIVEAVTSSTARELNVTGNAKVLFSTEGLGYAEQALNNALSSPSGGGGSGVITMAWKETY